MTTRPNPLLPVLLLAAACATTPPSPSAPRAGRGAASADGGDERTAAPRRSDGRADRRGDDAPARAEAPAAPPADAIPAKAQRLFQEALKSLEDQKALKVPIDWALMERKWRAVTEAGEVAEAHFNLGVALDAQGQGGAARAEYERALLLKPGLRQARVNLAVLVERGGDPRAAAAAYGEILRDFPEDAVARERMAALYRESGQHDDAWRLAREALLRDPRSIGAYKTMVRVAIHRKDHDVAKLIALRAQKIDERDADLAFLVGEAHRLQGEDGPAAAQYAKTLELAPGHLGARHALLQQAVRKEAWPQVIEQANGILAEEKGNAAVLLLRGIARRHSDKPDEAMEDYARAEKLAGAALPEVHLARGVLLMRDRSECEPALQEFDRYTKAAGPILPKGSPVPALQRECDEMIAANKAALEAARQMQLDAEKAAAAEAAKKAAEGAGKAPEATPEQGGKGTVPGAGK